MRFLILTICLICAALPAGAALNINEVCAANASGVVDGDGDCQDWVEIHNNGPDAVDLAGYHLSDDAADPLKWTFPTYILPVDEQVIVLTSGKTLNDGNLHASFKIDAEGELIILTDQAGAMLDFVFTGLMLTDISRGVQPDGSVNWAYFATPTPGASNLERGYIGLSDEPSFATAPGFHPGSVAVSLVVPGEHLVRYSLDGSVPDENFPIYSTPVLVDTVTAVRARAFREDYLPSRTITGTFIPGETFDLPVISITTDPYNLWSDEAGIYAMGPNAEPDWPYQGANFWEEWERPADVEFFDPASSDLSLSCGIRIHGGYSRGYDQKSLRLIARDAYGFDRIEYPFFEKRAQDSFKRLIVRNTGQDFPYAHCRDPIANDFAITADLEWMATRPCVAFLNGMYWGYMNVRERIDQFYLEDQFGVDPDELDLIGGEWSIQVGDADHWYILYTFITYNDISVPANYEWVKTQMEVDNFAEYNALSIYLARTDWPDHNVKRWRPHTPEGRWRWIWFDIDHSLGAGTGPPEHDTIDYATNPDYDAWHNLRWSTIVLDKMLDNLEFRNLFLNYFCDHLNSTFLPATALATANDFIDTIAPEIPAHRIRWNTSSSWAARLSYVYNFIEQRPQYAIEHMLDFFALSDTLRLHLDISPPGAGRVSLTAHDVNESWSGVYFQGVPIPLRARPEPGYVFSHWSGDGGGEEAAIEITPGGDVHYIAVFEEESGPPSLAVINEINYHSADDFDSGDWIELHNQGDNDIDLSAWVFKDADDYHVFTLPEGTTLQAGGYLLLCQDLDAFAGQYPGVSNTLGDFEFGLDNNGELLRLFSYTGELRDQVAYDDEYPWPEGPDGGGYTLELMRPGDDNSLPASWLASTVPHGTPGVRNSVYEPVAVPEQPGAGRLVHLAAPWPNPFNPSVNLSFSLERDCRAVLTIHDIRGRMVASLLDDELAAGRHELNWRPEGLASGVYCVRLHANDENLTRKLVLLK